MLYCGHMFSTLGLLSLIVKAHLVLMRVCVHVCVRAFAGVVLSLLLLPSVLQLRALIQSLYFFLLYNCVCVCVCVILCQGVCSDSSYTTVAYILSARISRPLNLQIVNLLIAIAVKR